MSTIIMPSTGLTAPNPLHITVRFTSSIPDLSLDILQPSKTTVVSLKHLIRSKLPNTSSSRRLRLIYSGRLLSDTDLLHSALKLPSPPPRPPIDLKGKGKAVDVNPAPSLVFINCSIGDILSPEELSEEISAAKSSTPLPVSPNVNGGAAAPSTTTTPAPRGFDRLLATGFTPAEVGQLRLQFLSIQAAMHTPDTMPSPTTLRRMEDAWIDDNGAGTAGGSEAEAEMAGGALDDLLWGHIIGFLWPLGAMAWLSREEGVWSARRQTAVWTGFLLCLTFGIMNVLA
jgi:hypothetical protein